MNRVKLIVIAFIILLILPALAKAETESHADWMSNHKELMKDLPVNRVTLLGSHDSGSCDIHVGSPVVTGYLTHSGHHKKGFASRKGVRSAVCQSASIRAQLEYGVRHIDLRVAHQDGQYWLSHMYISTPAFGPGGVFTQIKDFIKKYPDEIILMTAEHLYSKREPMTSEEAGVFYKKLKEYFGDLFIERGDFSKLTYGKIWEGRGRIILIGDIEPGWDAPPFLWDSNATDSRWMNEKHSDVLISELRSVVNEWKNGTSSSKLRRLQAMTTAGNKLKTAKTTNAKVRKMIQTEWSDAPISVLQVDDAVNSGLMPLLINKLDR